MGLAVGAVTLGPLVWWCAAPVLLATGAVLLGRISGVTERVIEVRADHPARAREDARWVEVPAQEPQEPARQQILAFSRKWLSRLNPGDVCPDLIDEGGSYLVVRLIERGADFVVYEVVAYKKSEYNAWFEGELRQLKGQIVDPGTRETLKKGLGDHWLTRWLESN